MKPFLIPIGFVVLFLVIRSIHFTERLNFSHDQGLFSLEALRIWQERKVVLIGPTMSLHAGARSIFQGSLTYYLFGLFLSLANWQPASASYLFMVWAAGMVVPLYFGVKWLTDRRSATLSVALYTCLPFYVLYTTFLWNPNFQLVFATLIIFLMGLYKKTKRDSVFFLLSVTIGLTLQLHYQFILVVMSLFGYYFIYQRKPVKYWAFFFVGLALGMGNLVFFEVRHQFYNTQTTFLMFQQFLTHGSSGIADGAFAPHYVLTISLFVILLVLAVTQKWLTRPIVVGLVSILVTVGLVFGIREPSTAFGMPKNWTIVDEERTYQLIRSSGINEKEYNIVNLAYDTVATNQKFFHARDHHDFPFDDYYHNHYLFIISSDDKYFTSLGYEVTNFTPSHLVSSWPINSTYTLYLLQRDTQ